MNFKTILASLLLASSISAFAQSGINNPITKAVLAVYEDELKANPQDYTILISRADEYYRHDEYIRALDDVNKAFEYIPTSDTEYRLRAYVLRAGIYNQTHRPTQALVDLEEAYKLDSSSFSILHQKANTEFTLGKYSDARLDFQRLSRLNPRAPEAYIGLARVAVKENNLGTANENLDLAIKLDPTNAEVLVRRASVRKLMGDHSAAVDDLILALSIDSNNSKAMQELVEYGNVNYPVAIAGLSRAVVDAPSTGMFRYLRAGIAEAHYHYLAAIEDYKYIIDNRLYDYHGIYASIATCQFGLGNYSEALSNIDYALGSVRNNAHYFCLRSSILRALGRNEEAVDAAAYALAVDRQSIEALNEMALAYIGVGNYAEASNLLGEAILTNAEDPTAYMLRAWLMENFLNKPEDARRYYTQVTEMDHFYLDNPRSLRGFALLFLGETDAAYRWMENILKTVEDYDGLINYYGACFYAQAEMESKALECTTKALDLGYANYHNWNELKDGKVNVGYLRDDLRFLNLLSRHNNIFGK